MSEYRLITKHQYTNGGPYWEDLPPAPAALSEEAVAGIIASIAAQHPIGELESRQLRGQNTGCAELNNTKMLRAIAQAFSGHVADQTAEVERLRAELDFEKSNHAEWVKRVDEDHAKLKAEVERLRAEVENRRDSGKAALKAQVEVKCLRYELAEAKKRIERQIAHIDGQNRIIQVRNQRIRELEGASEPPQTQPVDNDAVESQDAGAAPDSNSYRCAAEWRDKCRAAERELAAALDGLSEEELRSDLMREATKYVHDGEMRYRIGVDAAVKVALPYCRRQRPTLDYEEAKAEAKRIADLERQLAAVTKERDSATKVATDGLARCFETVGHPLPTDDEIREAAAEPISSGGIHYTTANGIRRGKDALIEAIIALLHSRRGAGPTREQQLLAYLNVVRYGISGKDSQAIDDAYNRLREAMEVKE